MSLSPSRLRESEVVDVLEEVFVLAAAPVTARVRFSGRRGVIATIGRAQHDQLSVDVQEYQPGIEVPTDLDDRIARARFREQQARLKIGPRGTGRPRSSADVDHPACVRLEE